MGVLLDIGMEKDASLLAALGVHMGQNAIAKKMLVHNDSLNLYKHMFDSGVSGEAPTINKALQRGVVGSVVPEVNVIAGMSKNFGKGLEGGLAATHLGSYKNLTDAHKETLRNLAHGNFKPIFNNLHDKDTAALTHGFLQGTKALVSHEKYHEGIDSISKLILSPEMGQERDAMVKILKNSKTPLRLSHAYKGSYISKAVPHFFRESSVATTNKTVNNYAHLVPEAALNAGLAYLDPISAGFNMTKRIATSPSLSKVPGINKVQKGLAKILIHKPFEHAWKEGLAGNYKEMGKIKKFLFRDVFNPLDYDMHETVGKLGQALHFSPERKLLKSLNVMYDGIKNGENQLNYDPTRFERLEKHQVPNALNAYHNLEINHNELPKESLGLLKKHMGGQAGKISDSIKGLMGMYKDTRQAASATRTDIH